MEEMPDLQHVFNALRCLYHDTNPESKERASSWLQLLQQSVFAWRVGDMLLQHNADMESSYFGAQTLRTKVQSSFTELPAEAHSSLRESLINHLKNTNEKTNSVVITQLCLALADLALQMPSWTNPIDDLLHSFTDQKNPSTNNLYPLLEVLSVIPEEVQHCRHLKLGANRRSEVRLLMSKSSTSVLRFLEATLHLQVSDQRMHNVKVLRCFKAWITTQVAPVDIWGHSSVLNFAFEILKGNESSSLLHEAASDAICSFLEELVECSNVPSHLKEMVVLNCKQLSDAYLMAVAGEDSDKAVNYCRVFTHTAESMLYDILGDNDVAQPKYMELLDMIIGCCGHPEYEVAEITFGFWYKLSEEVYRRNMDSFTEIYRTYVERLLYCLKRHAQIEPDHEGVLEDSDEFSDFQKGKHSDPSYWLDCLAAIFRHLSITSNNGNSHPCQAAMVEIWPVLSAVVQKYQSDRRICERMCRCLRFGLRCLGRFSAPLIGSIVKQITEIYSQHPHSCFLYLGSILVDEYAGDKSCAQGFLNMLESFLGPAYALLEKPNGLRDNPDTVDDLFRLCTRLLQRYPAELLGSRVFSSLLECSLLAATLDHRDACSSVMKFISVVVYFAYSKPSSGHDSNDEDSQRTRLAQGILQSHGATIVSTILNASIFQLSTYSIHDVAEVLYAFASGSREGTGELLRNAFASLPRTTGSGCATATDEQLHTFLQKAVKSTSSKEISKALREFVRLFR